MLHSYDKITLPALRIQHGEFRKDKKKVKIKYLHQKLYIVNNTDPENDRLIC